MTIGSLTAATAQDTTSPQTKSNDKKIADAASQFEALMIGQILKGAHGSESEGWLGAGDDDESSSTAIQVAEEYLGQAIAKSGGLGIARMVVHGITKPANSVQTTPNSNTTHTDLPRL